MVAVVLALVVIEAAETVDEVVVDDVGPGGEPTKTKRRNGSR